MILKILKAQSFQFFIERQNYLNSRLIISLCGIASFGTGAPKKGCEAFVERPVSTQDTVFTSRAQSSVNFLKKHAFYFSILFLISQNFSKMNLKILQTSDSKSRFEFHFRQPSTFFGTRQPFHRTSRSFRPNNR